MDSDTVATPSPALTDAPTGTPDATDATDARGEHAPRPHHAVVGGPVALVHDPVRHRPTSAPSDFATTLAILERVDRLKELGESLVRMVERESGLRQSEFAMLDSLRHVSAEHPRHLGRDVGLTTAAAVATAESLAARGLAGIVHDDAGRPHSVYITDAGMAVLTQAEAVQIRATDAAVREAGPEASQRALDILDQIIVAMTPLVPGSELPAGEPELRLLPGA